MKPRTSQLDQSGATTGDVLTWDGTEWAPQAPGGKLLMSDDTPPQLLYNDTADDWLYQG